MYGATGCDETAVFDKHNLKNIHGTLVLVDVMKGEQALSDLAAVQLDAGAT